MAEFKVKNGLQAKRYLQTTTAISNAALTVTYRVTVANPGSGNKYYIDGALLTSLTLYEGVTYIFDQSDSTNSNHPLRFSETANGTHASGSAYTTGVTTGGTPGSAGSFTKIVVASGAPTLYTYCTNHSNMGFTANTVASLVVDLNKGNNFSITPSGNQTFAFTNPPATGKAQAFSIEVTGGSNGMSDIFSTTLYTGNGGTQSINTGIDLSGSNGGLVWIKGRSGSSAVDNHILTDTVRGNTKNLYSNLNIAQTTTSSRITSFNSNGFGLASENSVNNSSTNFVSWTWKKTSNFFDIVTYTGSNNGTNGQTISHNLGSVPGMILIKNLSNADAWRVFHRSQGATKVGFLNLTNAFAASQTPFENTAPTSTQFTLGTDGGTNYQGHSYVAYLFAHNNETINCGTFATNSSGIATVTTGFQPQWLLLKNASGTGAWHIVDTVRGMPSGADKDAWLMADYTNAESVGQTIASPTATGFVTDSTNVIDPNATFIYVAIAANAAGSLTWPTEVKYPSGTAPTSPALGKKDIFNFMTIDGGTSYLGKKAVEGLS